MKNLFLAISFFMIATGINAQTNNETQSIEGFRDLIWGGHVDSIFRDGEKLSFTKVERNGAQEKDGNYYTISGDNMKIGAVELTQIYYVFSMKDDRLFKVLMEGKKKDTDQMRFIVDYKYGESVNEAAKDDKVIKQWIIRDVYITLREFTHNKFELELKSDWQAAQAFKKNTSVDDF
jgi:hypothetical protein